MSRHPAAFLLAATALAGVVGFFVPFAAMGGGGPEGLPSVSLASVLTGIGLPENYGPGLPERYTGTVDFVALVPMLGAMLALPLLALLGLGVAMVVTRAQRWMAGTAVVIGAVLALVMTALMTSAPTSDVQPDAGMWLTCVAGAGALLAGWWGTARPEVAGANRDRESAQTGG